MSLSTFRPVLLVRAPGSPREELGSYVGRGGFEGLRRARALPAADVTALVSDAELAGRGGAAFPTGRKWELARAAEGAPKYVVANAGEHEPGSRKDRVLVETHPLSILEGMAIAAHATGATRGFLYLIEDMQTAHEAATVAIQEARAAGFLGPAFDVEIALAPTSYVAGEETAALEVIEGRKALPREKPPYPGSKGLFGRPTTVNNVETLAHVPAILREGPAWFRALGVPGSAGTLLATLPDSLTRPGVYEIAYGTTFRELIDELGGGLRSGRQVRAILPALSSAFLASSALDLQIRHDALRAAGSSLGCLGVSLVEEGDCLVERCLEIARFFMAEQCGQCPPCRMETNTIAAALAKLVAGEPGAYRASIEKVAGFTAGKGLCSLIEMAATPVLSALRAFPEDFEHHREHGRCPGQA